MPKTLTRKSPQYRRRIRSPVTQLRHSIKLYIRNTYKFSGPDTPVQYGKDRQDGSTKDINISRQKKPRGEKIERSENTQLSIRRTAWRAMRITHPYPGNTFRSFGLKETDDYTIEGFSEIKVRSHCFHPCRIYLKNQVLG